MEKLLGKTPGQLLDIATKRNWPPYTAKQLAEWLYSHKVENVEAMTNIPLKIRREIQEDFIIGRSSPIKVEESTDGTKKYLFRTNGSGYIESAYIPEGQRHTICVSSQAGCRIGCSFCMTGKQGFHGHLDAADIINQVLSIEESGLITNIVYMGMGEPLDNLGPVLDSMDILTSESGMQMSPRRITLSTIGMLPAIEKFLDKSSCRLAVSLHSPFAEERAKIVPAERAHPVSRVIELLRGYKFERQRRVSFEYIVFGGVNHSTGHARAIAQLIKGLRCRINLIRFHPVPGVDLSPPREEDILEFRDRLEEQGVKTTIRRSRGMDIQAACGMLSTIGIK